MPTPRADVAHLLRRTGFGGTAAQIDALVTQDLSTIVDGILALPNAPAEVPPALLGNVGRSTSEWRLSFKLSWYGRMVTTPTPFQEKMVLFWHNHFTSQLSKVRADLMYEQTRLFRAQGLGNFRTLTKAVSIQPAMLVYLDNYTNRVGRAQENFARELWELFTLGVDQYTQDEILESARAWTGHSLNDYVDSYRGRDVYLFKPTWHDNGNKTIFGVTKNWDGPEVIDHTLDGPKRTICAKFMAAKLWSFFAYPNPDSSIVDALAGVFLANNWEIKPVVRAMLMHPEFYSATAKTNLIRTPVEMIVAALRYSGVPVAPDTLVNTQNTLRPDSYDAGLGMELGEPPDVSGWRQNNYWITTSMFFARANFARALANTARRLGLFDAFSTGTLTPTQMADTALAQFGIEPATASATTRQALVSYLTQDNTPSWRAQLGYNAIRLILLSPDFALA